jgi:hypothetical protein
MFIRIGKLRRVHLLFFFVTKAHKRFVVGGRVLYKGMTCFLQSVACSLRCFFPLLKSPLHQPVLCSCKACNNRCDYHLDTLSSPISFKAQCFDNWFLFLFQVTIIQHSTVHLQYMILKHTHSFTMPLRLNTTFQSTDVWGLLVRRRKLYSFAWRSVDVEQKCHTDSRN